jgi:two-component system nitrogen regulation response regulator NtrX
MAVDVLVVDDEADIRLTLSGLLEDEGWVIATAGGSNEALKQVIDQSPPVVVLDVWLEGSLLDGLEVLTAIQKERPDTVVLMMSGHSDIETAVNAIQDGAYDFIEKPFNADRMIISVSRAIEAGRLRQENAALKAQTHRDWSLIGQSQQVAALRGQIARLAKVNSRVLITGPSGAGKEVIARNIHSQSDRADAPFIAVNCASIRPETMEAALFGEETIGGVITPGLLQNADGGSVLLDEVADMPLETQAKMLRVIQEQTFTPVSSANQISVDVRVLVSTSRDLQAAVREGSFREDLYFRLNVVPVEAPALADRVDDIPILIDYFIERAAASGQPRRILSSNAMAALQAHAWPGNVRQLRNVVEWLLIMAPGAVDEEIGMQALPPDILKEDPASLLSERRTEVMELPLKEAREVFERNYLSAQVARFGGNVSKTAKSVGMERSALHRKMRALNIGPGGENVAADSDEDDA